MLISLDTFNHLEGLAAVDEVLKNKQEQRKALNEIVSCNQEEFSIHDECRKHCRSSLMRQYVDHHTEALRQLDEGGSLPLHRLLSNELSSVEDALMMIEKYPAAVRRRKNDLDLPLHIECSHQCRSSVISTLIELYPEALTRIGKYGNMPLHKLLYNSSSTVRDALMMIKKCPAALQHQTKQGYLPLHIECSNLCRLSIISKCMELYPEGLNRQAITMILKKVNKSNLRSFYPVLSIVFAADPMRLYPDPFFGFRFHDIIDDPYYRRPIFNLLPRHVFTPRHESEYRDLNWQPRAAMMMLLSQIKIDQESAAAGIVIEFWSFG
jgi:hypothetical protein